MKLYVNLTFGLIFALTSSLHAQLVINDNFDGYPVGGLGTAFSAAYQTNYNGTPAALAGIGAGTGLGGSQSLQNTSDTTFVRRDTQITLAPGDSITVDLFFQQNGAPSSAARPQVGLLGLNDGGGIFNGGTGGDVSARIGGGNNLELRANNGAVFSGAVQALTSGLWYDLRFTATKSLTANNFDLAAWIYNSDNNGNVGTLVDSVSFAGFANATIYNDTSLWAGFRESSTILNLDNFSANIVPVPEPGRVALLSLGGAVAFFARRRVMRT